MQSCDRGLARIVVVGALVAALGLAGCGRKTGLDPPPSAAASTQDGAAPAAGPGIGPDGQPVAPPGGPKRPIFLDWLID